MTTCEQCGADAVNTRGVCEECGWQAATSGAAFDDSSPSLGDTRAADVPFAPAERRSTGVPGTGAPITPLPPLERTTGRPNQPTVSDSTIAAQPRYSTAAPVSTSRYCGTCGARIAPGEAFCGQCGTPVGAGSNIGTALHPASGQYGRYQIESNSTWSPAQGDAPTEAFIPSSGQPYARDYSGAPNARGGYASSPGAAATQTNASARTGRIIVGVVCLIGSLASAIGAIVLAVAK